MKIGPIVSAVLVLLVSLLPLEGWTHKSHASTNIEPFPKDLEMDLALSSLPGHLRGAATVYVLNPSKGFEVARKGTNGFHALVARIGPSPFLLAPWTLTKYRDDIIIPISFDEAGARTHLPFYLDTAKLIADGTAPEDLKEKIQERFKSGYYKAPSRAGVSYMLSPVMRNYIAPDKNDTVMTINYPHYMFYAPNVSNEDIGGQFGGQHPFILFQGPHGYIIQGLGLTEKAVINKEHEGMLARLCDYKKAFCLAKPGRP